MGDLYRAAHVLGLDLSPIQPEWVPPNVKFMVDDVESPWLRPKNHFDYIHARHMVVAIKDWPKLMERAFEYVIILPLPISLRLGGLLTFGSTVISNQAAGSSSRKSTTTRNLMTIPYQPTTLWRCTGAS